MVDTMIRLHEDNSTDFDKIGICVLPDAITCEVVEARNGEFELEMTYSVEGRSYSELMLRRILVAKPNPFDDPQPFRIYEMSKPINGVVTVRAEHISYDLTGYSDKPFEASSIAAAMVLLKSNSVTTCPFEFTTDKTTVANMTVDKPASIRSLLGGTEGSILDTYGGGEYEFNRYNVKLWSARGENRGVTIRYGKNLTDLQQEENCANVYTHVYPYYYSDDDGLITLDSYTVAVPGTHNYTKILPLDLSDKFDDPPNQNDLRTAATKYINDNNLASPKVSLDVSFVQLAQSEEYKEYALLETVHLCDTVTVQFPKLGVSSTAKCIRTVYNVLTGKYSSIELGEARTNLAATVAEHQAAVETDVTQTSVFKAAVQHATKLITGGLGGYVVLHSSTGGKTPDEILVMDQPTIASATNVWRWNKNGLGHSNTGYNGTFGLAMTYDGQIVADRITTGTLNAGVIKAGILQDYAGKNYWNMQTGEFRLASTVTVGGSTVSSIADAAVDAQTQQSIFNKLTNNGQTQGIYLSNGKLYINATYIQTGNLNASLITSGKIQSNNGKVYFDLDNNQLRCDMMVSTDSSGIVSSIGDEYITTPNGNLQQYGGLKIYSSSYNTGLIAINPATSSSGIPSISSAIGRISVSSYSYNNLDGPSVGMRTTPKGYLFLYGGRSGSYISESYIESPGGHESSLLGSIVIEPRNIRSGNTSTTNGGIWLNGDIQNEIVEFKHRVIVDGNFTCNSYLYASSGYIGTSDKSLKAKIKPIDSKFVSTILKDISAVEYEFKHEPNTKRIGFIAQDVEDALTKNGYDSSLFVSKDADDHLGLKYIDLLSLLWEGWKYHEKRIADLERRMSA